MSYSSEEYCEAIHQALAKANEVKAQWSAEGANEIAERLATLARADRRRFFREVPLASSPEVVQHLLARARQVRGKDLQEARRLARLAVGCSLEAARFFPRRALAADACADALAELGGLARASGDFAAAEVFFRRVDVALEHGTGDKYLLVSVLRRKAAVSNAQRKLNEASDLLRLALRIQAGLQDPHEAGKVHLSFAIIHNRAGKTIESFDSVVLALEQIDPARDAALYFRAVHNSILYMTELGWHDLALSMADGCAPHYPKFGDDLLTLRGGWVRGRLHGLAGRPSVAERLLDETRRGFAARNLSYEAALATLDLARLYAKKRDMRKVAHLVREAYPVFVAKNIPREAAASLLFFADTAKKFGATAAVIEELVQKLHALRLH